jgi:HAD superfamily hydrolase (TIGR01509 family)
VTTSPGGIKTLLFDIDGTLIDSNDAHARSWAQALEEHGIRTTEQEVRRLIGMGGDKLLPAVAGVTEDSDLGQAFAKRKKQIFEKLIPTLHATNGARALLEFLRERRIVLAIATSADDKEVNALLKQADVDEFFDRRASKDDAAHSKPDPDIVHAAIRRADAQAESTLLVGDTPYDIDAARQAEIRAIALRCGGYWSDAGLAGAVEILDDPAALLTHLRAAGL